MLLAFLSGIGITAIGPGGIFITIALFLLTTETPATIAGTASAMFIATGILGSGVYVKSGELSDGQVKRMAIILSITGLIGALFGVYLNALLNAELFGVLLGAFVMFCAILILLRQQGILETAERESASGIVAGVIGLGVGTASGMLGVGGPVVAVPLLVMAGVPMLTAVAAAQVQSIFIAAFATAGYVMRDAVSLTLAVLIGAPMLAGVVGGWKVAHMVDPDRLKVVLSIVLFIVGPYLALA